MSIVRTDLKFYKSVIFNDTSANGGAMSNNAIVSGAGGNIFPTVTQAKRLAGATEFRKIWLKNAEDTGLELLNSIAYIENPTSADDRVVLFIGNGDIDTQADIVGDEKLYGCGWLNASLNSPGATTFTVLCEDGTDEIFTAGDLIRISNKEDLDDLNGTEEYRTIDNVTYNGDIATIEVTEALDNAYSATNQATRVASVINLGTIVASSDTFSLISTNGDYNIGTYPIVTGNIGTITQTWTCVFTSTTAFSITGNTVGLLAGSGTVGTGAAPANPSFSGKTYFNMNPAGFSGSFQIGDSFTFKTYASAEYVWVKRIIPAATPSFTNNRYVIAFEGESE